MKQLLKISIITLVVNVVSCSPIWSFDRVELEKDTLRNSVIETFGLGYRSPDMHSDEYSKGSLVGGVDLHIGFQYNRLLPLGFYATIKASYSRCQNVMDYTRIRKNTLFQGDSLYRETIVTEFHNTNSYIFVDGGIGLGKILKYNRLAIDVSAIANYRIIAFTNVHIIDSEEELQQLTEVDFHLPNFPMVLEANAFLRYYTSDEAYFLLGLTYQITPEYIHTTSGYSQSFDSMIYKIGYGFDF